MKKILSLSAIALAAIFMMATDVSAQRNMNIHYVQKQRAYYYYPGVNVYYDISSRCYIYPEKNMWQRRAQLPKYFYLTSQPRFVVYNNDNDVWRLNREHADYFRGYYATPSNRKVIVYKTAPVYRPKVYVRARF